MKIYKLTRTNRDTGFVITATCTEDDGVFIVKAGSVISPYELKGLSKRMRTIRADASIDSENILLEDIAFESLYDAACFVIGTNANDGWFKLVD